MEPTWGSSGANSTQVGPMLAPWTLLSGGSPWQLKAIILQPFQAEIQYEDTKIYLYFISFIKTETVLIAEIRSKWWLEYSHWTRSKLWLLMAWWSWRPGCAFIKGCYIDTPRIILCLIPFFLSSNQISDIVNSKCWSQWDQCWTTTYFQGWVKPWSHQDQGLH